MKPTHFLLGSLFALAAGACLASAITQTHVRSADCFSTCALLLAAASELQTAFRR